MEKGVHLSSFSYSSKYVSICSKWSQGLNLFEMESRVYLKLSQEFFQSKGYTSSKLALRSMVYDLMKGVF